ncbi:MAG: RNA polymerase sigma factor [Deltaproteobacteria bacterium]|nr:RNA polymerase sigma factor [Deltaproteobacteria bacterium]
MQVPTMHLVEDIPESPEQERELLLSASAGDELASRTLFRTHVGRVHRRVSRILGSNDPDVEDVVQRVFLAALDSAPRFACRSSLGTWLLGIATRKALDEARARKRRQRFRTLKQRVGLGRPASRPDVRHGALSQAERLLAELSVEQRTVFLLHAVEGHTFAEIRELTGVGISTLHARLKAARRRLDALNLEDPR